MEPLTFTHGLWQQVLDKFSVVPDMQDTVDTLVHQFFLVIPQVLRHVLGHEHHIAFQVHDEEEPIKGLGTKPNRIRQGATDRHAAVMRGTSSLRERDLHALQKQHMFPWETETMPF